MAGRSDKPSKLVLFPEDLRPGMEETGPTELAAPRPRASEMPTMQPGPSPIPRPHRPASAPVVLPKRAPRPSARFGSPGTRRAPPKPSLPGDVRKLLAERRGRSRNELRAEPGRFRKLVQARDRRTQRGRIVAWFGACVFLVAVPLAAVAALVPDTWRWLLAP